MANPGSVESHSGTSRSASAKTSWRGRRKDLTDVIRHRWQKDWAARPLDHLRVGEHRRRLKVGAVLTLFVALVAFFVYYLLYAPVLTPLVAIGPPAGHAYRWPFPPNAWAAEDIGNLKDEDLDGTTLNVVDISSAWRSKDLGLESLDRQLRQLAEFGTRSGAVIIYIR